MSKPIFYQEIFDIHQKFFEKYIKMEFSPEKNGTKFSNWRLSYINYISDVKNIIFNIFFLYSILMIFFQLFNQRK